MEVEGGIKNIGQHTQSLSLNSHIIRMYRISAFLLLVSLICVCYGQMSKCITRAFSLLSMLPSLCQRSILSTVRLYQRLTLSTKRPYCRFTLLTARLYHYFTVPALRYVDYESHRLPYSNYNIDYPSSKPCYNFLPKTFFPTRLSCQQTFSLFSCSSMMKSTSRLLHLEITPPFAKLLTRSARTLKLDTSHDNKYAAQFCQRRQPPKI